MEPCIELPLPESVLEEVEAKAKDWAGLHGVLLRTSEADPIYRLEFAPFVLLPSPFPKQEFLRAKSVQKPLNELLHQVAHDREFLTSILKNTVAVDEFTARLFRIYETVQDQGAVQKLSFGIVRCDYLLDVNYPDKDGCPTVKQVEMNTIASSFGSLATQMSHMHRYVLEELGHSDLSMNVPENSAVSGLASGLVSAWNAYGSSSAVLVILVEPFVRMIADQRLLEYAVRSLQPDIRILRRTLRDFGENGSICDQALYIEGHEVAVVYFRDGYMPHQYPLDIDWEARLMLELSRAIKCPSIHYQLVGTKKVQQELAKPDVLKRFIKDSDVEAAIWGIFTGLYSLDESEIENVHVKTAIDNPQKFVLKPQREGGGNNLYGDDVKEVLQACKNPNELSAYILMDRIVPPTTKNYLIKPGSRAQLVDVVSELGIFGIILGSESEIMVNEEVGHLLRTKQAASNEGGVVAGFAALDGMYLI